MFAVSLNSHISFSFLEIPNKYDSFKSELNQGCAFKCLLTKFNHLKGTKVYLQQPHYKYNSS